MNLKKKRVNLLTSNTQLKIILKIIKVFLLASICLIPFVIIALVFTKGKMPSFSIGICLIIGSLWAIKQEFGSLKAVGFTNKSVCKHILYGMILCIIYYLTVIGVNFILGYSIGIESLSIVGIVGILCKYIIVGFSEETLCRGYVLKLIYNEKHSANKAIIVQAIIFMMIHIVNPSYGSMQQFIFPLILGILLGFLVLRQQSLWSAIVFHILLDFINDILIINKSSYIVIIGFIVISLFIGVYKRNEIYLIRNEN
ncbi:CPBP family intramembrane glutamic endopeptidase [Clostridium saccharobutylicum]|uniref:CAAX amino terminal protease self-immunity n=1 Tax=Clostridium saccharobutylicum TaxID=169679 RepID=A0A1S8ND68_CLOSA|nr:CPBP family intramembrane glutamic endopeptidase [Clostridium saccharobutylicum]OOM14416.1 CAAX amino terminal protease self- immunity [Clostridium saccharobutylicum]